MSNGFYSEDFRQKVIAAVERGDGKTKVSRMRGSSSNRTVNNAKPSSFLDKILGLPVTYGSWNLQSSLSKRH